MYFDHKIFVLSNKQLEALKNNSRHNTMNEIKKMSQSPHVPVPKKQTHHKRAEKSSMCELSPRTAVPSGIFSKKIHIGRDEITNLKIELALCNDVQEFIDRM